MTIPVGAWLAACKSEHTRRSYVHDWNGFCGYVGLETQAAATVLLSPDGPKLMRHYRECQIEAGRSNATVNRAMSTLESLRRHCRRIGLSVSDEARPQGLPNVRRRLAAGPTFREVTRMAGVVDTVNAIDRRAHVIILLAAVEGWRAASISKLTLADVNLKDNTVKGVAVDPMVMSSLRRYLVSVRGFEAGPIFTSLRVKRSERLTPRSILRIIRNVADLAGVDAWTDGLRFKMSARAGLERRSTGQAYEN